MAYQNLHLKPYVRIHPENTEADGDTPREDQAIRPYQDHRRDMCIDGDSNESEVAHDFDALEVRTRILEENTENSGRVEHSTYTIVIIRDRPLFCGVVIVGDAVLYGNGPHHKFVDEKPGEAHVERRLEADFLERGDNDIISNESNKLMEKTAAERPNRKHSEAHLIRFQLQSLEAELLNISSKSVLKVSGKRQRSKKLSALLGAFDTFHFVNLAPLSWTVLPVSRQTNSPDEGSSEQSSSSEPPGEQSPWPPDFIYNRPWADFRHELYRLGTFVSLPSDFPVFVLSLAQAGFIRLPDGAIVCYFCRARRDQWRTGDSPREVHRQLNLGCALLTGLDCSNVSVATQTAEQLLTVMDTWSLSPPFRLSRTGRDPDGRASATPEGNSSSEVAPSGSSPTRSASGLHQPDGAGAQASGLAPGQVSAAAVSVANSSSSLANQSVTAPNSQRGGGNVADTTTGQAGRSNTPNVRSRNQPTPAVGRTSSDSRPSSTVSGSSAHLFEGTARPEVLGSGGRRPPPASSAASDRQTVTYQQLGITTQPPKRPDMVTVEARLATFSSWPSTHIQTPLALAEAGFYYAGYADCGRCFQCGGGLKNWVATDNPWVEHARWFHKCQYIKQNQGQDFIDAVSHLNNQGGADRPEISMDQVTREMRDQGFGWDEAPAIDPAITAARAVGYSERDVDSVAQRLRSEDQLLTVDRILDYLEAEGATVSGVPDDLAEVAGDTKAMVESLTAENWDIRRQRLCKVCLDREVSLVFLPCGHLACCAPCAPALRTCPVCRQRIEGRVRAFPVN